MKICRKFIGVLLLIVLPAVFWTGCGGGGGNREPAVTVVFLDDFEDKVLDGWALEHAWSLEDDTWVVNTTWAIEEDAGGVVLNSEVPSGGWARAALKDRTFGDFILRARVKLLEGDASLLLRHELGDAGSAYRPNRYTAAYDVTLEPNAIGLYKLRNGEFSELARTIVDLNYGQWHTLTVTNEGGTITIILDGTSVLSYSDTADPILTGGIAFESRGHLHMDDVATWLNIPSSDAVTWSPTAPLPAGGGAISVAPSDPEIVYLGASDGVFRSGDGGRTWSYRRMGHVFSNIAVHPSNPDIIYVSNGVPYRSDDGGNTYVLGGGWEDTAMVQAIAISRSKPDIVYAAETMTRTVYRTENGGQIWTPVGVLDGVPGAGTLLVHPADPDRLFVAVRDAGMYTSADGGVTWTRLLPIVPLDQSLIMHPADPNTLYIGDGKTIYRTTDAGATWTPLASSPSGFYPVIPATNPAVLYVSGADGVYRSDDGGEGWSLTDYDTSVFGRYPLLGVSPADADLVYAGVEGGVVLSSDGGASWSWSNNGLVNLDAWQLAISPTDPDRLYAGTFCMRGIFQTTNTGSTWALVPEHFHYVMEIAVVPLQPEVLYVTHWNGLYISSDGGDTWHHVADTGNYHLHGLAVDPANPRVAYVGSTGGTGELSAPYSTIYKTTDGGVSWTEVNNGFPATDTSVQSIVIDTTNTDTVYVATYREGLSHTKGSGIGIYKSTDGGGSWTPINQGLTTLNVSAIAVDPFDARTVYAGTDRGLFITTDGGEEWMPVGGNPVILIDAIVPDPARPGTVYITTEWAGVFRTTDRGASWVSLNQGLPQPLLPMGDLMLDSTGGLIYVAVRGGYATTPEGGVYRGVMQPR